jgi:Xaa-Pro aminopeptidase
MRKDIDGILAQKKLDSMLLYSESCRDANMYYVTGFLAPDPFIFLKRVDEKPLIAVNQMEFPRAKKESKIRDVRPYADYDFTKIMKSASAPRIGALKFIAAVAKKELGTRKPIYVPPHFSAIVADVLRREGLKIKPTFDVVEKARETKEHAEIEAIKSVQKTVEKATSNAVKFIAEADVDTDGRLFYRESGRKKLLVAGKVRSVFDHTFLDGSCVAEEETIIACGPKGADPHYTGDAKDVLKANQPIVLDVFPRNVKNRYVSDMTRTIVKGRASRPVKKMFETVLKARDAAMDAIRAGVLGNEMQNLCFKVFEKAGYQTIRGGKQISKGYIHGLGHGVGLDVHEAPSMSEFYKYPLQESNVVTVEPGLYDPELGGVRIEDIVEVTKKGCNNLTKMEVCLEV